ncbi:MAG: hypothetical protein ACREL9_08505 [Gemmatimonadales bacterium]
MRKIVWFAAMVVLEAIASFLPPSIVHAQGKVPERPKLDAGADTNHAPTYYGYGLEVIETKPDEAAAAFYWATRLDPSWAQPLYARRIALLLSDRSLLFRYIRRPESPEARSVDSLELRARMLNPFVIRDLDFLLRSTASLWIQARRAASQHQFSEALDLYRMALSRYKNDAASILVERGHLFYVIGKDDSARVAMELALEHLREREAKEVVHSYESKAVLEHSIGMIHERKNNREAAREAYGRALQEDLGYYPAHVRLGMMALAAGDTVTALSELALAVEIKRDEPVVLTIYGSILAQADKFEEAERSLGEAVELEPYYPAPHWGGSRR